MAEPEFKGPRISRPAASAVWTFEHRWGTQIGDVTTYSVSRTDRGALTLRKGNESVEIRRELVFILAAMVREAAAWTDAPASPDLGTGDGERTGRG